MLSTWEPAAILLQAGASFEPLQADPGSPGVSVPLFPFLVALAGVIGVVLISLGALRSSRPRSRLQTAPRRERARAPPKRETVFTPLPVAPAPSPVYKKAPVSIHFPMIRNGYPDVWGVREPATIVFRAEDKALVDQKQIPGLVASIDGQELSLVFLRGEARVQQVFETPGERECVVELRVRGETLARRTRRVLRVVDYREEIAEVFSEFRDHASRTITPLRADATPWEIFDALLDAGAGLPKEKLRQVVAGFEEAKFSNHPVGRPSYEKMVSAVHALRQAR